MMRSTTPRCSPPDDELRAFVDGLIGKPWVRDARNCWRMTREIAAFCGYDLPLLFTAAPAERREKIAAYAKHCDASWTAAWRAMPSPPEGFAVALMHRPFAPAQDIEHCGAWLPMLDDGGVLHCDAPHGVCFDTLLDLAVVRRWTPIFYVPSPS